MIQPLLISALLGALLACTSTNKTVTDAHHYGGRAEADSLFLSIERTPCFGRCPAYTLQVYRHGYATFNGRSNTPLEGLHEARVPEPAMERILNEAMRIGFFDLQDKYDGQVTDLPSTIVRVVADGRDKKVVGRYKMPESFRSFALYADSLLIPSDWQPVKAGQ